MTSKHVPSSTPDFHASRLNLCAPLQWHLGSGWTCTGSSWRRLWPTSVPRRLPEPRGCSSSSACASRLSCDRRARTWTRPQTGTPTSPGSARRSPLFQLQGVAASLQASGTHWPTVHPAWAASSHAPRQPTQCRAAPAVVTSGGHRQQLLVPSLTMTAPRSRPGLSCCRPGGAGRGSRPLNSMCPPPLLPLPPGSTRVGRHPLLAMALSWCGWSQMARMEAMWR